MLAHPAGTVRNPARAVAHRVLGFLVFVANPVSTGARILPYAGPMKPIFATGQPAPRYGRAA